jgi:DNA-binding XRE family transcriptional regulator
MAVEVSRRTQHHLERDAHDPEWWLPLALLGCLFAVVACAATALAL